MKPNKINKLREDYDLEVVSSWQCPEETGVPLLTMPNIPLPLHNRNPRNIMGKVSWDRMRKRCYFNADYKCEICGAELVGSHKAAHELYSIDYKDGTSKFERAIAICDKCHNFIHSGRMITMYGNENPMYPKSYVLRIVEKAFRLIHDYNKNNDGEPLRVYATILSYLEYPSLASEMRELIKKYDIKFYTEDSRKSQTAKWGEWKLIIGNKEFPTLFKSQREWQEAMDKINERDARSGYWVRNKRYESLDDVEIDEDRIKRIEEAEIPDGF